MSIDVKKEIDSIHRELTDLKMSRQNLSHLRISMTEIFLESFKAYVSRFYPKDEYKGVNPMLYGIPVLIDNTLTETNYKFLIEPQTKEEIK